MRTEDRIQVQVVSLRDMETTLERCIELLIPRARSLQDRGILITQYSPTDYVVELHAKVPYGTTRERRKWK